MDPMWSYLALSHAVVNSRIRFSSHDTSGAITGGIFPFKYVLRRWISQLISMSLNNTSIFGYKSALI